MAIHPRTRLPSYGKILTADVQQCRVQFDRGELGVHLLDDTEIMPFGLEFQVSNQSPFEYTRPVAWNCENPKIHTKHVCVCDGIVF
eukprot:COSAG05_NODE_2863_length_2558_cov_3.866612_2_plen_86_part_00